MANDARLPWSTTEAFLYGRKSQVRFKTFCAQWYRACGVRLLRVVVVVPTRLICAESSRTRSGVCPSPSEPAGVLGPGKGPHARRGGSAALAWSCALRPRVLAGDGQTDASGGGSWLRMAPRREFGTNVSESTLAVRVGTVVLTEHGQVPIRVFFCTDPNLDVARILETYAGRWGIEVFFREAKQLLGFADSAARLERAVRRVAPLVGLLYTVLVVWFLEHHGLTFTTSPPLRPWYRHKSGLSFADILREARSAIAAANVLDLLNDLENFQNAPPPSPPAPPSHEKLAA